MTLEVRTGNKTRRCHRASLGHLFKVFNGRSDHGITMRRHNSCNYLLFRNPSIVGSEAQCVVKCCVSVQGTKDRLPIPLWKRGESGIRQAGPPHGASASNLASRFRFSQAE